MMQRIREIEPKNAGWETRRKFATRHVKRRKLRQRWRNTTMERQNCLFINVSLANTGIYHLDHKVYRFQK